jgi:hypothetical protein
VTTIRLIQWKAGESEDKVAKLASAGLDVDARPFDKAGLEALRAKPPAAVVIDLDRMPSQGRDLGLLLRKHKATRNVPLVFAGGEPEKVERVRSSLPDAAFTPWSRIRSATKRALARPPTDPVVPGSTLAGYAGTPLPRKLGIKADSVTILAGAPPGFEKTLGALPEGATLRRQARGRCNLIVWFTKSRKDLEKRIKKMGDLAGPGGLWVAWPKKTSGVATDLTQATVRKIGLASGLVDYKVCSIDSTWTGLRFTKRKRPSGRRRA